MKIEGKENVWFHSQINLNLHYKGKGYSGQQSVNWKHKAFPYYKRESVTTFLHEQGHDKMNNFIYYLLKFHHFWNFKFFKIFFYEVIISFKSLNARIIKPRK